jgi:hypothetical protein
MNELKLALKIESIKTAKITKRNKSQSNVLKDATIVLAESFKVIILLLMTAINKLVAVDTKLPERSMDGP